MDTTIKHKCVVCGVRCRMGDWWRFAWSTEMSDYCSTCGGLWEMYQTTGKVYYRDLMNQVARTRSVNAGKEEIGRLGAGHKKGDGPGPKKVVPRGRYVKKGKYVNREEKRKNGEPTHLRKYRKKSAGDLLDEAVRLEKQNRYDPISEDRSALLRNELRVKREISEMTGETMVDLEVSERNFEYEVQGLRQMIERTKLENKLAIEKMNMERTSVKEELDMKLAAVEAETQVIQAQSLRDEVNANSMLVKAQADEITRKIAAEDKKKIDEAKLNSSIQEWEDQNYSSIKDGQVLFTHSEEDRVDRNKKLVFTMYLVELICLILPLFSSDFHALAFLGVLLVCPFDWYLIGWKQLGKIVINQKLTLPIGCYTWFIFLIKFLILLILFLGAYLFFEGDVFLDFACMMPFICFKWWWSFKNLRSVGMFCNLKLAVVVEGKQEDNSDIKLDRRIDAVNNTPIRHKTRLVYITMYVDSNYAGRRYRVCQDEAKTNILVDLEVFVQLANYRNLVYGASESDTKTRVATASRAIASVNQNRYEACKDVAVMMCTCELVMEKWKSINDKVSMMSGTVNRARSLETQDF